MCFRGSTIRGKMNRADRYVLFVSSRAAGARKYVPERREKDVSDKHSVVKQFRQNCGSRRTSGNNDTCVGYTSQSRAPRHKHGGRHGIFPMERPCPPPSGIAFEQSRETKRSARCKVRILSFIEKCVSQ